MRWRLIRSFQTAGFDADGNLSTYEGIKQDEAYSIFHHPLEEILRGAYQK